MKVLLRTLFVFLVSGLLLNVGTVWAELTIGNYTLVSSKRVSRVEYEYTYKADVTNTGTIGYTNVTAAITSNSPYTTIMEPDLSFSSGGLINPDETVTSDDTFTLRHDRRYPSVCDNLSFEVTGEPQQTTNPGLYVTPEALNFEEVFVGSDKILSFQITETGDADLVITNISSDNGFFSVFPPTAYTIQDGGPSRTVSIGFSPTASGEFSGLITIESNAGAPVIVNVSGIGVEPVEPGDITLPSSLEFGNVSESESVNKELTIKNDSLGPLMVSSGSLDQSAFALIPVAGKTLPFNLNPGESKNIVLSFTPPTGSGGTTISGNLTIESDDPDEGARNVLLSGNSVASVVIVNNPVLGATVDGPISVGNCSFVSGVVQFGAESDGGSFIVTLTDQQGNSASSSSYFAPTGAGNVSFGGIDACSLADGIITVSVEYDGLDPVYGTPTVKNTSTLAPPVLDPLDPVTANPIITVCGTSQANTTVSIEGGARPVSISLDGITTAFCVDVPLKTNTQNTLIATAVDDLAVAPKPVASAEPVSIVHVDPSEIIVAEATSRPLTVEEIETLVENNIINLNDPSNFNVSMFTIVLTIGQFPVTVTQPVVVDPTPGTISYGGGGGWIPVGGGGSGGSGPSQATSHQVVLITPPQGPTIPGVIIIDGRIKTLKEFYQVTIAIQNTSTGFDLKTVSADVRVPAGLTPIKAGPGTDISTINVDHATDHVDIGLIPPGKTGTGQFIVRGDGIGTHNVDVDFNGFIAGGGIPEPIPFDGSVGTTVQVFGPPELDVLVRHPSDPYGHDVELNEIYTLTVELTNKSPVPALYTSLELKVGGNAQLVDGYGTPIPGSTEVKDFGHIQPGQTVSAAFRVQSLVQGEIIACQAVANENINLTIDTGPDGTPCNIANSIPVNFEFPPGDEPPVLMAINPLNGQPNIPVTTSILAILTPPTACLTEDTWENVAIDWIDPYDHSKGIQVISADLVSQGTFYLEELDADMNPVRHIPADLTIEDGVAGDTTIAVLRLGLKQSYSGTYPYESQYFLQPNTFYRATLVGGEDGICNETSGVVMENSYSWTFSTEQTCDPLNTPAVEMSQPFQGSIDRPLNQKIVLDFTNRMDVSTFSVDIADYLNGSFAVVQGATESGGEISGGALVPGNVSLTNLYRTLVFTPTITLDPDAEVFVRLTDEIEDQCGNPLQTPPNGIKLFNFLTIPPDTTPPESPEVNPIPELTNQVNIQVSGSAEPGSTVTVTGGSASAGTTADATTGLFSLSVPLRLNAGSTLSVEAADASENVSSPTTTDTNGDPLVVTNDSTSPNVTAFTPFSGAANVSINTTVSIQFNEPIKPETINSLNFKLEGSTSTGTLTPDGDSGFIFTPDSPLNYNTTYTIRMRTNGIQDLAGNGLTSEFTSTFSTESYPLPVIGSLTPASGTQGQTLAVTFSGTNLASASAVVSDNPGIFGSITSVTDTSVDALITITPLSAPGMTTIGLTTLGGSTTVSFTVLHRVPAITGITPDHGTQGETLTAVISGSGLSDVSSVTVSGDGVTAVDLGTGNDSQLNIELTISSSASEGTRTITVTAPGGSDTVSFTVNLYIPPPVISGIVPDNGTQGETLTAVISGSGLSDVSSVTVSGDGVTAVDLGTGNDSQLNIELTISSSASEGARTITVTTPGGSDTVGFTVNLYIPPPVINAMVPSSGEQGQTLTAQIQGENLDNITNLSINGAGVNLKDLGGNSTVRDIELTIDLDAPVGIRIIDLTSAGGMDSVNFTVLALPAPDVTAIVPAGGLRPSATPNVLTLDFNSGLSNGAGGNLVYSGAGGFTVTFTDDDSNGSSGGDANGVHVTNLNFGNIREGHPTDYVLGAFNAFSGGNNYHSSGIVARFSQGVTSVALDDTDDDGTHKILFAFNANGTLIGQTASGSQQTFTINTSHTGGQLIHSVEFDTQAGSAGGSFDGTVFTIDNFSVAYELPATNSVTAEIQGTKLSHVSNIDIDGVGVTVTYLGTGDDNHQDIRLDIQTGAALGDRTITLTTLGGSDTGNFIVVDPPSPAMVVPVPVLTNEASIQVEGTADPNAIIRILGGTAVATGIADGAGNFSIIVNLIPNTANSLQVYAGDAYGNEVVTTLDSTGAQFTITQDSTAPQVTSIEPGSGETDVELNATIQVDFSEPVDPATVISETTFLLEGSVIPGAIVVAPDRMSLEFTPDVNLTPAKTYTVRIPTEGITDQAGNGLASEFTSTFTTVTTTPVDLRVGWTPQGAVGSGAGIWNVSADGTTVTQTENGNPTFFVSPEAVINRTLTGTFRTTDTDDDWMGFVFGYQAPFSSSGDATNDYEFFLFDWKQNSQDLHPEGFTLSRVTGTAISRHQEESGQTIIANDLGSTRGWVRNRNYEFRLEYTSDSIRIWIIDPLDTRFDEPAEQLIFDVTPEDVFGAGTDRGFVNGRFGFFNQSQRYVTYSGFVQEFQSPPQAPTLSQIQPLGVFPGSTNIVSLFGSDLETAFEVRSTNPDVNARIVGVAADGTDVEVELTADAAAAIGLTTLTVETFGGQAQIDFVIDNPPTLSGVAPAEGFQGQTLDVTFTGTGLASATEIVSSNAGIGGTITSTSDTSVQAQITIQPDALTGSTDIGLCTAIGQASQTFIVNLSGVSVRVAQESAVGAGDFEANVLGFLVPIETTDTAVQYFSYGTPDGASYNGVYPPPTSQVTSLFFVDASDGLHLFLVHDKANDVGGGSFYSEMVLEGAPGAGIVLEDDPGETTNPSAGIFRGNHTWSPCCTDGMVIGPLPSSGWAMTARATTAPTGIDDWEGVSDDDTVLDLDFEVNRRIRFDMLVGP